MTNVLNMLLVWMLLFSALSCSNKENSENNIAEKKSVILIDIENHLNNQIESLNLSDVANSIEIIPLELTDRSMIKAFYGDEKLNWIGVTEKDVVTACYRQILHFSKDGKFLNEIGKFGGGPEEYSNTHSFVIQEKQREVYVMTGVGIKVYSFDGEFIREASKQKGTDMFHGVDTRILSFSDYLFLNDKLPLDQMPLKEEFCSLSLTDSMFNVEKKFFNPIYIGLYPEMDKDENRINHYSFQNYWTEGFMNVDYYGEKFKIKHDGVDTIYQFNEKELTFDPVYSLALGKRPSFEMSHAWIKEPAFFSHLWVYDFYDSKDYILFLAGKNDMLYTVRYNKSTEEIKVLKKKSEIRERNLPGSSLIHKRLERSFKLTNDLCGGVDFVVNFKTPSGYWVSVVQPSDLLEKIDIDDLKQAEVKDKAARDKLVKILSRLSEDDNPVLFIAKLK